MVHVFAFVSYVFVSCITPGPNNIMSMNNGAKYGVKKSMPFCAGVATGFSLILICCILSNLFLNRYIPKIVDIMTVLGAGYILYLAWIIWRDKPKEEKKKARQLDTRAFSTAVILQFVNPKGLLFGITLITNFVFPYYQSVEAFLLVLGFNWIVVLLCCGCWVLFGSVFRSFFEKNRRILNVIMALLLVYCAVSLFI
ncbi:LysE family translocator [Anaerotignum sp. MB30-C6]|uniref:LysE family translocator n=1 Tax=Anaerotignum sp. MB30-C6 TaxID=3070814 RepID=UPI0027DCC6CE|nr:LysE family transporter [Anaerotignum sp. MB30-C6]WMI81328.1 LysE family transporter [Anaerotignum sp. MB30-C6]